MNFSIRLLALLSVFLTTVVSCAKETEGQTAVKDTAVLLDDVFQEVPLAGNAFLTTKSATASEVISNDGLANWTDSGTITSVYFRVQAAGELHLKIKAKVGSATGQSSKIKVSVGANTKEINLSGTEYVTYDVGYFDVSAGYVQVDLQGISKTGSYFADVSHLAVGGDVVSQGLLYANDPDYYYWARRGPSCHMGYTIPTTDPVQYYYGELTVPEGQDVIGSYFMSNGFAEGYFGIQVNSSTERRILFSVWSPYSTDNPEEIPEDQQIILNRKGEEVFTGEFGNEGSGGQSYLVYNWQAGLTYKFLLKGEPDGSGATDFDAWIYLEDKGGWYLIASWKRPETSKNLTGYYSFVENFSPDNGYLGRKVSLSNRWIRTVAGGWLPVQSARFTVDATYQANQRIDAIGGVENNQFYLQNGGFFAAIVAPNTTFSIQPPSVAPDIDFSTLP